MSAQPDMFGGPVVPVPYFDTTKLPAPQLREARAIASHQDDMVIAVFDKARKGLTPSEVWRRLTDQGRKILLTSVRRSMTNLSNNDEPELRKTTERRIGAYGRPEWVWERVE
jgi:hypothetical protein